MGSWITFFFYVLIHGIAFTFAQPNFIGIKCGNNGNYTSNSAYSTNLDTVLSSISSNTNINYGFYNFSVGQDTDTANAIALCRGDVDLDNCRSCVKNSTRKLTELCPNQEEAIGWYDSCMLRYSNRSIFHALENEPSSILVNTDNVSNVDLFNQALAPLLNTLKGQAAGGSSTRKFASGNTTTSDFVSIYVLMECTPDLSQGDCNSCLDGVIQTIPGCCNGRKGVQILTPSCDLRYGLQSFVNSVPSDAQPPPDPQLSPPPPGKNNSSGRTAIIIVISLVVFVILAVSVWIFIRKRKQRKPKENVENAMDEMSSIESLQYDFGTIEIATDYFSNTNKLGQGGFGAVYKGTLQNGKEIAVKRLSTGSAQGDLEFKTEILLVAKLQHRNLVRLLGFCLDRSERLLIYEFMPNASLDHFIFDPVKGTYLDWKRRYNIIGGIARGMLYLHEDSRLRIIHRDLKASNILLDAEMNPKIADFGMARLFELDETQGNTNRIVGTYGYMAPEYAMHGLFSVKSDVFSFGILVLEIVSGQKNHSYQNGENVEDLSSYAWKNWRQGTASNLIDPTMSDSSGSMREMMRCIHIGLLCVQENENDRPTMASVVLMLNSFSLNLPVPLEPAFFMHSHSTDTESSISKSSIGPELPLLRKHSLKGNESSPFSESRHANLH